MCSPTPKASANYSINVPTMTEFDLKALLQQPFSPATRQTLLNYLFADTFTQLATPQIFIENADNVTLA